MNIMIAINSKYLIPAKVMLTSLFENNHVDINIYLLHSSLKKEEVEVIRKLVEVKYNGKLYDLLVDESQFETFPISHHFTIEAYYRFLAQSITPKEIDRILWLDADMIIKSSIEKLYYQEFNDKHIVVCQSINKNPKEIIDRLNLDKDSKYFNSGMILFNLNKIRKTINPKAYFEYIENNRDRIVWLDQDVLNVIYNNKSKYVDYMIYNMQTFSGDIIGKEMIDVIEHSTAIIHYIGSCKPWHFKYNNYCSKFYWKYAKKSEGYNNYLKYIILHSLYNIYTSIKDRNISNTLFTKEK